MDSTRSIIDFSTNLAHPVMTPPDNIPEGAKGWLEALQDKSALNAHDDPNYFTHNPISLCAESRAHAFLVGTGDDLYSHMQASIENARLEIVLITCFWANSSSLDKLAASLKKLSNDVVKNNRPRVRVHIGFSSLSVFQKLFQTSSLSGRTYAATEWSRRLGLPSEAELPGLEVQAKSIFVRPFSVMHPKFLMVDRKFAWIPSCNVSWEPWFEGAIAVSGPIVERFVEFWRQFWVRSPQFEELSILSEPAYIPVDSIGGPAHSVVQFDELGPIFTMFLPSPHHVNPRFRPLPWQAANPPPPTPLNVFLLTQFLSATSSIYMQSPNVTSPPVLSALLKALRRGVNVHIVTSERLMILEQLGTAGKTTTQCMKILIKRYKRLKAEASAADEETGLQHPGQLTIEYFSAIESDNSNEPVQSHLKMTLIDGEWLVLGSGNMDRASWYTSQELGLAFLSQRLCTEVKNVVDDQLTNRKKIAFTSDSLR
ncbi:phospholipase D/nuclease [Trichodelitschia bisporula]|uniref:Phospholipase D/nuclease n=1 Tax=Trichodelitschia bisporula TaxID=703511 RepID=A0A6G1I6J3_9PEZI|nr:phospholipase D/nuclease [Trichodelitschia bisporula]